MQELINHITLGNCLEVMKRIPDNSVDLILTDPPYLINYKSNHRKEKFDRISNDTNPEFILEYLKECFRILKDNSSAYVFCDYKTIDFFKPAFELGFNLKNILIWVKNNWGMGDLTGAYAHQYEMILFGHKGRSLLRSKRYTDIILSDRVDPNKMVHPTEKPIELLEFLILNSTDENDIVFDGCAGSGTTLIAAKNTKRSFIGIELEEAHYLTALKRIENHQEQLRLF